MLASKPAAAITMGAPPHAVLLPRGQCIADRGLALFPLRLVGDLMLVLRQCHLVPLELLTLLLLLQLLRLLLHPPSRALPPTPQSRWILSFISGRQGVSVSSVAGAVLREPELLMQPLVAGVDVEPVARLAGKAPCSHLRCFRC